MSSAPDVNAPLISVITPTFNCGAKISATAASVLSQEAGLYEFLVIDGGSTDDTLRRLQNYSSALRWLSEPDAGIYDAMNKGIRLARGRFLYFLGAGDCLRPDALRAVADRLPVGERGPQFVYGDVLWVSSGGRHGGAFDDARLVRQNICHQAIFYDRTIFDLLGQYEVRYKACADYAMNIRCFGNPAIRKTHVDLVVADYEGGGVSGNIDRDFFADIASLAWRDLGPWNGVRAYYWNSAYLGWARWLHVRLRLPLRTLPGRITRKLRRSPADRP